MKRVIVMKGKKMPMHASKEAFCPAPMHGYYKGKALASMGIGLVLIVFGLNYIGMNMAALVIGAIIVLKGAVKLADSHGCWC